MDKEIEEKEVRVATKKKSVTIKLSEEIKWGEELITEITIKPPRGKHLRAIGKDITFDALLKLAAKLSGVSSAVFDEMCSEDCIKVADAVGELL